MGGCTGAGLTKMGSGVGGWTAAGLIHIAGGFGSVIVPGLTIIGAGFGNLICPGFTNTEPKKIIFYIIRWHQDDDESPVKNVHVNIVPTA